MVNLEFTLSTAEGNHMSQHPFFVIHNSEEPSDEESKASARKTQNAPSVVPAQAGTQRQRIHHTCAATFTASAHLSIAHPLILSIAHPLILSLSKEMSGVVAASPTETRLPNTIWGISSIRTWLRLCWR